jgi:ribonuclease E
MSQALFELRGPVTHEALRLRMAAMHGREDPLLDTSRFIRLLRQANDAEVADVRKVGEDEYEISPHRTAVLPPASQAAPAKAEPQPAASSEEPAAPVPAGDEPAAGRDNGARFGVRFRRGSRGSLRPGEIPLIGVVEVEPSPAAIESAVATATKAENEVGEPAAPETEKPARPRRAPRKKKAAAAVAAAGPAEAEGPQAEKAAPAKRPRSRAKKKAE